MFKKNQLTKAELEIMKVIWEGENMVLGDIMAKIGESGPAYTTVSTIIRILVKKGFLSYKAYSKVHCYFPLISKEDYAIEEMQRVRTNFFDGSMSNMLSFFAKREKLSPSERDELLEMLKEE